MKITSRYTHLILILLGGVFFQTNLSYLDRFTNNSAIAESEELDNLFGEDEGWGSVSKKIDKTKEGVSRTFKKAWDEFEEEPVRKLSASEEEFIEDELLESELNDLPLERKIDTVKGRKRVKRDPKALLEQVTDEFEVHDDVANQSQENWSQDEYIEVPQKRKPQSLRSSYGETPRAPSVKKTKRVLRSSNDKPIVLSKKTKMRPKVVSKRSISSASHQVTAVNFKHASGTDTIELKLDSSSPYSIEKDQIGKKMTFSFKETGVPSQYHKNYDASQFQGVVRNFVLKPKSISGTPVAVLEVNLNDWIDPSVVLKGNEYHITFASPKVEYGGGTVSLSGNNNDYVEENIYAAGKVFTGKKIKKLEVKNSDIQDVLRMIARYSGYNVVIGDDVKGKVGTMSLSNIPWDQAFTLVLQSKKLGYIRHGNVLRVATLGALKAEKDAAIANEDSKLKVEGLQTVLIPVGYASAKDLASRATKFLSSRGSLETDDRTNTIIARDVASVTRRIQKLITALDTQPPRVSISAKIVEVTTNFNRQIGFSSASANQTANGINIGGGFSTDPLGGAGTITISAARFANLSARFELGQLEGKVSVLANPQVTAVNNQKASVSQSITQFLPESVNSGGTQTTTFKEIKANLSLEVTPIVSGEGGIFMDVQVTNEVPTGPATNKQIDTRSVATQVLVDNGDTAVIGGVFNTRRELTVQGVPWLMKIPLFGLFFSNQQQERIKSEVLIFLTPKILNPKESFVGQSLSSR